MQNMQQTDSPGFKRLGLSLFFYHAYYAKIFFADIFISWFDLLWGWCSEHN